MAKFELHVYDAESEEVKKNITAEYNSRKSFY